MVKKPWTRNQKLIIVSITIAIIALVLQYMEIKELRNDKEIIIKELDETTAKLGQFETILANKADIEDLNTKTIISKSGQFENLKSNSTKSDELYIRCDTGYYISVIDLSMGSVCPI